MLDWITETAKFSLDALVTSFQSLFLVAAFFILLAAVMNGRQTWPRFRRALPELVLNLKIMTFNVIVIVPFIALAATAMYRLFTSNDLALIGPEAWAKLPAVITILIGVTVGDFVGYWRHRFEHTKLFWPSHAVHHSDTEMTWFSLQRFHPINRVTTYLLDNLALFLLGVPPAAIIANGLVRQYYGYFIHADLPWTYGPLGRIFVSPAMHRWHHAADARAFNTNYATVYSLWDRWFGTFRVPGPCDVPLGVTDDMEASLSGQLSYAFSKRAYPWLFKQAAKPVEPAK
jgi:sterol desaturase/sphingolipid hydroxylase (fatty acid hydroxylase superfamily)